MSLKLLVRLAGQRTPGIPMILFFQHWDFGWGHSFYVHYDDHMQVFRLVSQEWSGSSPQPEEVRVFTVIHQEQALSEFY